LAYFEDVDKELVRLKSVENPKRTHPKRAKSGQRPMKRLTGSGILGQLKQSALNA
jgi:hypothetical protein